MHGSLLEHYAYWSRGVQQEGAGVDYIASVLALSPVAFWGMQEASGNPADLTGNGWTATAQGSPTYQVAGPTINGEAFLGITLDGSADHFTVSSTMDDPGTTGFTVAGWGKHPADASDKRGFLDKFSSNEGTFYLRKGNDYGMQIVTINTSNGVHGTAFEGSDMDDTWVFIAARYDVSGGVLRVWQGSDTNDDTSFDGTWDRVGSPTTYIGRENATYWNGEIALLGYWDTPLSDAQMTSLRTGEF